MDSHLLTLYDAHIVINSKSVLKYPPELWGACQVLQTLQRRARTVPLSAPCLDSVIKNQLKSYDLLSCSAARFVSA